MQTDGCWSLYGGSCKYFSLIAYAGLNQERCIVLEIATDQQLITLLSILPIQWREEIIIFQPGIFRCPHTVTHTHIHTISACIHDNTHRAVYSTVHDKRDWQRGTKKEANLNPRLLYTNNPWDYRFFLVVCQVARIVIYRLEGAGGGIAAAQIHRVRRIYCIYFQSCAESI